MLDDTSDQVGQPVSKLKTDDQSLENHEPQGCESRTDQEEATTMTVTARSSRCDRPP